MPQIQKRQKGRKGQERQRGIALVSVLGVIAMITAIVAGLAYRQQLSINLQGYALQKSAGALAILSAEQMAAAILADKNKERAQSSYDDHDEGWAEPVVGADVGGVNLTFMIFDAQANFNINNVNARSGSDRAVARRVLRTLLNRYGSTHNDINDWVSERKIISKDRVYLATGAEFDSYRMGNTEMVSLHELRLIAGLRKRETLESDIVKFEDYFSFFPIHRAFVKVNVNTADDALLTELLRYFGAANRVAGILDSRPYRRAASLCARVRSRKGDCRRLFDTKSSYFYVFSRVQMGDTVLHSRSLLKRTKSGAETVMRQVRTL